MTKQETELQKQIMLELSKFGIVIRQQSGNFYTEAGTRVKVGFTGISDLQFISDDGNLIVFIEIKTKTGNLRPEQKQFIEFINAKNSNHLRAGIARSVDDALKLIEAKKIPIL